MTFNNAHRQKIRRIVGLEEYKGVLGGADGVVEVDPVNRPGVVNVCYTSSAGVTVEKPVSIGSYNGPVYSGAPVVIGWQDGELRVLRPNVTAQVQAGVNPSFNNGADKRLQGRPAPGQGVYPLSSHATSPASLHVVVNSFFWRDVDGTRHFFDASEEDPPESGLFKGRIDLSSYVPGAGEHCLVGLFLKADDTIFVSASTAKPIPERFAMGDIDECYDGADPYKYESWLWELADEQEAITDESSFMDIRQILVRND